MFDTQKIRLFHTFVRVLLSSFMYLQVCGIHPPEETMMLHIMTTQFFSKNDCMKVYDGSLTS